MRLWRKKEYLSDMLHDVTICLMQDCQCCKEVELRQRTVSLSECYHDGQLMPNIQATTQVSEIERCSCNSCTNWRLSLSLSLSCLNICKVHSPLKSSGQPSFYKCWLAIESILCLFVGNWGMMCYRHFNHVTTTFNLL